MDRFNETTTDIGAAEAGADVSGEIGASELIAYGRAMAALHRWVEGMEQKLACRTTA